VLKIKMIITESKRSSQMVKNFMEGDCLIFARALASIVPDSTIVSVMISNGGRPAFAHALVEKFGLLYDISGAYTEEEVINKYENEFEAPYAFIEDFKPEHLGNNPKAGSMNGTDFDIALSYAKKIKENFFIR